MPAILARCLSAFRSSVLVFVILAYFFFPSSSFAMLTACSSTISPSSMDLSSTSDVSFQITNDDTEGGQMQWVRLSVPSSNFTINGGDGSDIDFSGFGIGAGSYIDETISVTAGANEAISEDWIVLASDEPGGADAVACSGSLGMSIVDPSDSEAPIISDLTLSSVTSSSITISWTTNKSATSVVDYGTATSYGSTASDLTLKTSHSLTLSSLSSNTSYHYRVTSVDGSSNSTSTSDNTFATASTSTTSTTTVTTVVTQTVTKTLSDQSAPTLNLSTELKNPYKEAPSISGVARDNKSILRVEYSLDNGQNWHFIDNSTYGKASIAFKFTPDFLDDDNYKLKVRATDSSGNVTTTKAYLLIIDRLPPTIGASIFTIGPQIIQNDKGIFFGLSGLDQKIYLSAIGGPVGIDLHSKDEMFSLVKNSDSGLWSGTLSFANPGTYPLEVRSIDGADNKTVRQLSSIEILPNGIISGMNGPISKADITVYVRDFESGRFVKWDADSYGQANPQRTDSEGKYKLFIPPGTYYLEISAPTFRVLRSNIFTLNKSVPINSNFELEKERSFSIGPIRIPIPDLQGNTIYLSPLLELDKKTQKDVLLIGKKLPDVVLLDGQNEINANLLSGRLTLVTIMNSWDPQVPSQIAFLGEISKKGNVRVIGVFPQENVGKVMIFKKRGEYTFDMYADQDGALIEPLKIQSLPMHLFLDRRGVIKKIEYGILNEEEILHYLID